MNKEYYDKVGAAQQEKVAMTNDMVSQRNLVRKILALSSGESVLDVGSGNGILAREMASDVGSEGEVIGVDPAESMVAMAQVVCPAADFILGDAMNLPTEDLYFDAVTASQVLCFVPTVDTAVSEMYRTLKPGGRLVILDSDWGSLVWTCKDRDLLARCVEDLKSPYSNDHVPRTLTHQLTNAGFTILSRQTHTILNWEYSDDSYSKQCVGFISNPDDREKLDDELSQLSTAGKYMFSMNRYIFYASK